MDIASLLEVQVDEGQSSTTFKKDIADNKAGIVNLKPSEIITNDEMLYYRVRFGNDIAQVRFQRIHCTACDVHIGSAPSESSNMREHPLLKTLLCSPCREFYGDGKFEQGDDATDMFCRWCANGGNLYCCSYCSNTFCDKCIKRNFDPDVRDKIEADEKWKCFVCDPTDLFALRALCRALLHHVKTLSRILMSERSLMSAKEIEAKMELDDSKCCIGRRSRRKRRESSSDEELSVRSRSPSQRRTRPRNNHWSHSKRRKSSSHNEKQNITVLNGTSRFIPIAPRFVLQEMVPTTRRSRNDDEDLPSQLLNCEQTMIEGENETVTPQGIVLPTKSRVKIPDSILYNSAITLNPIPPQNISRGPLTRGVNRTTIPVRQIRKIDTIPPGTTPQLIRRLPKITQISTTPMVTLPAIAKPKTSVNTPPTTQTDNVQLKVNSPPRVNYLRCKSNLTVAEPSVIDLESDTEEFIVMETAPSLNKKNLDSESRIDVSTQWEETSTMLPTHLRRKLFEETLDNPLKAVDDILEKLRERLRHDLSQETDIPEDNDVYKARIKVKIIHRNIDKIVSELAALNNSIINRYLPWKESQITSVMEENDTRPIVLKPGERSNKYVTVDMECVRDSESDVENNDDDVDIESMFSYSNRLKSINEKDIINQGTSTRVEMQDKSTQKYDVDDLTIDYDKSIGYSLLMCADYNFERKKEVFKPVVIRDEFFGKYEEKFIAYLQYFEDNRNIDYHKENSGTSGSDDKTLFELINDDIAAQKANELLMDTSDDYNKNKSENEMTNKLNENKIDISEKTMNKIMPIDKINNTPSLILIKSPEKLNISDKSKDKDDGDTLIDKMSSQGTKHEETVIALRALIEEESSSNTVNDKWKNTGDDDECTILE